MKKLKSYVVLMMFFVGVTVVNGQHHKNTSSEHSDDSKQMQQELTKQDSRKYNDEVPADEIDPAVASAIVKKYPGYGIVKVHQAKDDSYKIKLEKEDDSITAYYSSNGELLKVENNNRAEEDRVSMKEKVSPQEQFQRTTGYEEIEENDLPKSVTLSLDDLYPEHEIKNAYRGDDGSYKVKVKNKEEQVAVYYDSDGLFYRDEVLDDKQEDKNEDTNQDW